MTKGRTTDDRSVVEDVVETSAIQQSEYFICTSLDAATSSSTMWSVPGEEASAARSVAVDGERQVAKTVFVGVWRSWRAVSKPMPREALSSIREC